MLKKWALVAAWFVGTLVVSTFGFVLALIYFTRGVVESSSPAGLGNAIVYRESSFGTVISFCVRDPARSGKRPIYLSLVLDADTDVFTPDRIVWSKDGSVVAARRDHKWAESYDFRAHKKVGGSDALMKARGGVGKSILNGVGYATEFATKARHPYWWESYPLTDD